MIQNIREVKECPDCASTNLVYMDEQDQVVCQDCQLVFEPLAPSEEERYEAVHDYHPPEKIVARKSVSSPQKNSKAQRTGKVMKPKKFAHRKNIKKKIPRKKSAQKKSMGKKSKKRR